METAKTHGITMKNKIGYALADTAGLFSFGLVSAFLQMFYTDSLHIPLEHVAVLMLVVRVWDAINDPIERSSLSMFRSIGSGLGGLPAQIILPLLVYTTVEASGEKVLDSNKLFVAVVILAVLSLPSKFMPKTVLMKRSRRRIKGV